MSDPNPNVDRINRIPNLKKKIRAAKGKFNPLPAKLAKRVVVWESELRELTKG